MSDQDLIGRAVIVSECEEPCGRNVAIVIGAKGDGTVLCQYLSQAAGATTMRVRAGRVTPLTDFGVELRITSVGDYWCEPVAESQATHPDGEPRYWQEYTGPVTHVARLRVLGQWTKES